MPCSNAAKTRNLLKFAGVPQTRQQISAVSRPKFTILWRHVAIDAVATTLDSGAICDSVVSVSIRIHWEDTRSGRWWSAARSRGCLFTESTRRRFRERCVRHLVAKAKCKLRPFSRCFCNVRSINQSINQFLKWPKWHRLCKNYWLTYWRPPYSVTFSAYSIR